MLNPPPAALKQLQGNFCNLSPQKSVSKNFSLNSDILEQKFLWNLLEISNLEYLGGLQLKTISLL